LAKTWAIVRSMKSPSKKIKQVTALSPSTDLFWFYRNALKNKQWDKSVFDTVYVPRFINELKTGSEKGFTYLNQLYQADKENKKISLVCFCPTEDMCHRIIVAGLLQAVGCDVHLKSQKDYRKYYNIYQNA